MVGVGEKVTDEPAQIELLLAAITTLGVTFEVTVIVTEFEVPVEEDKQVSLLVITDVTTSLFANVEVVYVLPVEVFVPFTFH